MGQPPPAATHVGQHGPDHLLRPPHPKAAPLVSAQDGEQGQISVRPLSALKQRRSAARRSAHVLLPRSGEWAALSAQTENSFQAPQYMACFLHNMAPFLALLT